jgi:hypothetical protein
LWLGPARDQHDVGAAAMKLLGGRSTDAERGAGNDHGSC